MAVFTEVTADAAGEFLRELRLGDLIELQGIQGGIENTNYFVTSEQDSQTRQWVLTLFERLTFEQLPFYLYLMKHLAQRGIPVPDPQGNASGDLVHTVCGKPAALVDRLRGRSELAPTRRTVRVLARRWHACTWPRDYDRVQPNLRGLAWWNDTVPVVLPHLDADQAALLQAELAYQNHVAASAAYASLPRGPVHADLFRDNVMFDDGPDGPELTGIFDFYFAGVDTWLFDLAVCLNDWCIDLATGAHDEARASALLRAYVVQRPLTAAEHRLLPAMLRAGALRFRISRLWDFHLPREASMLKPHDPAHFERVLRHRLTHPVRA